MVYKKQIRLTSETVHSLQKAQALHRFLYWNASIWDKPERHNNIVFPNNNTGLQHVETVNAIEVWGGQPSDWTRLNTRISRIKENKI